MEDHQIKCKIVRGMWRDSLFLHRKKLPSPRDVARRVVGDADQGTAEYLILTDMSDDPECPVELLSKNVVGIRNDEDAIAAYLRRYCESEDDIPWTLR